MLTACIRIGRNHVWLHCSNGDGTGERPCDGLPVISAVAWLPEWWPGQRQQLARNHPPGLLRQTPLLRLCWRAASNSWGRQRHHVHADAGFQHPLLQPTAAATQRVPTVAALPVA